jgi:hypothetical protein
MNFSFFVSEKTGKVEPQNGHNMNMISVTPERRQQLVDAYHDYLKKAKKK